MRRLRCQGLILGFSAFLAAAGVLAQDDQFAFMPAGGRALLVDLSGQAGAETLAEIAARDQSIED